MKKLVFMFVAFAAISLASCGNKQNAAANADSTATDTAAVDSAADSTATDSAAADSAAAPADSAANAQ